MWALIERIADLERRTGALYGRFAEAAQHLPPTAAFWREMAADEELHALLVTAAREVFPPSMAAPRGDWERQLAAVTTLLDRVEDEARAGISPTAALARAEEIERSELNLLTRLVLERAGVDFSRLVPLAGDWFDDRHHARLARARATLATAATAPGVAS